MCLDEISWLEVKHQSDIVLMRCALEGFIKGDMDISNKFTNHGELGVGRDGCWSWLSSKYVDNDQRLIDVVLPGFDSIDDIANLIARDAE